MLYLHIIMWQLLAFTSALFSAFAAVTEKKALLKSDPLLFSLVLSALTLVFTVPFLFYIDLHSIEPTTIMVLFGKSILGAFAFLMVMNGLKHLEISSSLPLLVLTPAVVAIVAFLILDEPLSGRDILGMLLLLAGTYVLQLKKGSKLLEPFRFAKQNKAYLFIIAAILLFTTTSVLDKALLSTYKLQPEAFLPLQQLFYTLVFIIVFLFRRKNKEIIKTQLLYSWKWILLVAVLAVVYRYSHILAVKEGPVALVLSIKRTSVFFATIIGGQIFHEQNLLRKSIAVAVMIAGAIFVILS